MKVNKKTLLTILFGLGAAIGIVSIFCFFGASINYIIDGPSMFTYMFGGTYAGGHIQAKAALTVLFVIEVIILLLSATIIVGNLTKKLKETTTVCLASIVAVLTLAAVIMSFCTVKIALGGQDTSGVKLGSGAVSYSILGIIGMISNIAGVVVYKKAK